MFTVGLGLQMTLKLILNMKKAFRSPQAMKQVLWRRDILQLGTFLGGFSGLFRVREFSFVKSECRNTSCNVLGY